LRRVQSAKQGKIGMSKASKKQRVSKMSCVMRERDG
jgi:hypothetical protein